MADIDVDALEDLAGQAKGYLRWAVFLLGVMAIIVIIDLQLKRSVAQQYERASRLIGQAVYAAERGRADGQQPSSDVAAARDDGGQPGSSSGDAVDGVPGVAEGTSPASSPKQARGRRVAQRPDSDGPRT